MCVCVCVRERERERERDYSTQTEQIPSFIYCSSNLEYQVDNALNTPQVKTLKENILCHFSLPLHSQGSLHVTLNYSCSARWSIPCLL